MIKKDFNPKERVVLLAIYEQSKRYPDGPFKYDVGEGQLYINNAGVALSRPEHLEIIRSFASAGVLDVDWLVVPPEELMDNPGVIICDFARNTSWAKKRFSSDLIVSAMCRYDDCYFINADAGMIKTIKDSFTTKCIANISFGSDMVSLVVDCKFENGSKKYVFRTLNDGARPYLILAYAMKDENIGKTISIETLSQVIKDKDGNYLVGEEEYITKIFGNNKVIKEVLAPLIEIKSKYICVKKGAKLTSLQYEAIKAAADSSQEIKY